MRHALSIHLHPDTIAVWFGEGSKARRSFGVQFTVDALVPCCVKLFWGVSILACNEFVQQRQNGSQVSTDAAGRWSGGRSGGSSTEGNVVRGRRWPRPATSAQESTRSLLEMEELSSGLATRVAANEDGQSLFAPGQYQQLSRDFFLPAGPAQRYSTPAGDLIDLTDLTFDISASWLRETEAADDTSVVPLAIVIIAQRRPSQELGHVQGRPVVEAHGQVSFVKFRRGEAGGPGAPEVIRQLSFGPQCAAYELQGIYGFEDEGEGDCMVCCARPKNVLLLPCRHCSVCHPCLRSLRDEKCPLCRSIFSSYATFPIGRASIPAESAPWGQGGARPHAGDTQSVCPGDTGGEVDDPETASSTGDNGGTCNADRAQNVELPCGATAEIASTSSTGGGATDSANRAGCEVLPSSAVGVGASSGVPESPGAPVEPARQARDVQLGRPRGVAPASRTPAQGLRRSGRARFNDRADNADIPLLEGGSVQPRGTEGDVDSEDCRSRREQAAGGSGQDGPADETHILIHDSAPETT